MIPVSVPLIFPKVVPRNWDTWNKLWEENKKISPKISTTKNSGQVNWIGFDIYVKEGIDADHIVKYKCNNVNCPELFPSLFDNLDKLPIEVHVVRVLQSISRVTAHQDFAVDTEFNSIRSMLVDNNPKQTWWYEKENKKYYLDLPDDTNTWWYDDSKIKHGTDYYSGFNKQLVMYRGKLKPEQMNSMIKEGLEKYPNNTIYL